MASSDQKPNTGITEQKSNIRNNDPLIKSTFLKKLLIIKNFYTKIKNSGYDYIFSRRFWVILIFVAFSFSFALFYLESVAIEVFNIFQIKLIGYKSWDWLKIFFWLFVYSLYLITITIFLETGNNARLQKLRHPPSWFLYCFIGAVVAPIGSYFLAKYIFEACPQETFPSCGVFDLKTLFLIDWDRYKISFDLNWLTRFSITFFSIILYFRTNKKDISNEKKDYKFAPGARGLDNDELDFAESAVGVAKAMEDTDKPISVFGLFGEPGSGKSSLARMIVESTETDRTLYTYISLTETNEAADFSTIFADRWFKTLKSRYPKLKALDGIGLLENILRETGNSFWSGIISYISKIDHGLLATKNKFYDDAREAVNHNETKRVAHPYSTKAVGKIFGNIWDFHEKNWIIIIDEIERAKFDEIYRVIEVIERFKTESQFGFPIKLSFILCVSLEELKETIKKNQNNEIPHLIDRFFSDIKNITLPVYTPPIPPTKREKFITNKFLHLKRKYAIPDVDIEENKSVSLSTFRLYSPGTFISSRSDMYDITVDVLFSEKPRIIERVISTADFFYRSFTSPDTGKPIVDQIRFADILILSYIKTKYPFVIDFFLRTIDQYLPNRTKLGDQFIDYLLDKQNGKQEKDIVEKIEDVIGVAINPNEKLKIEKLVSLVAIFYSKKYSDRKMDVYDPVFYGSTSLPWNFYDLLRTIPGNTQVRDAELLKWFVQNQEDSSFPFTIADPKDLVEYAQFVLSRVQRMTDDIYFNTAKALLERMESGEVPSDPGNTRDTILKEYTYMIILHLTEALHTTGKETVIKGSIDIFLKFLKSKNIPSASKIIFLNSFCNYTRGESSEIHAKLRGAFDRIMNTEFNEKIKEAIKYVFDEIKEKYIKEKKAVYDYEENFFALLHHYWSGNSNLREIESIRHVSAHELHTKANIIRLFWNDYPYNDTWVEYSDLKRDHVGTKNNRELLITLKKLVEVSKSITWEDKELQKKITLWDKFKDNPQYKEDSKIRDDNTTLKSVLISRDLLPKDLDTASETV